MLDGFWCTCCGQWHEGLPMDFAYPPPSGVVGTVEQPMLGATITSDWCISPDRDFLMRCCLNIPVRDGDDGACLSFGVWASVSERSYVRIMELWDDERCMEEPPYFSYLLTSIAGYPATWGLDANLVTHSVTQRPLLFLFPSDHPLAVEQRDGITMARVQEIAERAWHPPEGNVQT